jgi:hypothetical protein
MIRRGAGTLRPGPNGFRPCPIKSPTALSVRAISRAGGRDVKLVNGSTAIGWIGDPTTNVPDWQEYQLAVVVSPESDDRSCFTCCARPRWWAALAGATKSQRLAESLRAEIEKLAGES